MKHVTGAAPTVQPDRLKDTLATADSAARAKYQRQYLNEINAAVAAVVSGGVPVTRADAKALVAAAAQPGVLEGLTNKSTAAVHNAWVANNPSRVMGDRAQNDNARNFAFFVTADLKPDLDRYGAVGSPERKQAETLFKELWPDGEQAFTNKVKENNEAAVFSSLAALNAYAAGVKEPQVVATYVDKALELFQKYRNPEKTGSLPSTDAAPNFMRRLQDAAKTLRAKVQGISRDSEALLGLMHAAFVGERTERGEWMDDKQKVPFRRLSTQVRAMDAEPFVIMINELRKLVPSAPSVGAKKDDGFSETE